MHYKGIGCAQDYKIAANLFSKGAYHLYQQRIIVVSHTHNIL